MRFWFAWFVALSACGGQVEGGERNDGAAPVDEEPPDTAEPSTPPPLRGGKLPQCAPGFAPEAEPARPCDWLGAGLCYGTKLEACACVCPRDAKNTTCRSDFGGANSRTPVTCS